MSASGPPPPRRRYRQPFDPVDWAARNPKKLAGILLVVLVLGWFFINGPFFIVEPDEQGLVLTFGRHTRTVQPGFHLKWPWPIQTVRTPRVKEVKRIEVGFRTIRASVYETFRQNPRLLSEAKMLTGDGNIVNLDLALQFQIRDAGGFEFNVRDPVATLKDITEAAIRQVVGDRLIDEALTVGKTVIEAEVRVKAQELADLYGLGVGILSVDLQNPLPPKEVEQAFRDVETARQEKERYKNEALAYRNKKIPEAEGQALRIIADAEAKRAARIAVSEGEAERFKKLAEEYKKAPEVTRERLLLETLEKVLARIDTIVVDEEAGVIHLNRLDLFGEGR